MILRLGAGLWDVTVEVGSGEPLPAGVLGILEHWRTGRPSRPNLWAGYDREPRHQWAGVALGYRSSAPDRPPGATYDIDGRFVTDIEGFYCAIGEAAERDERRLAMSYCTVMPPTVRGVGTGDPADERSAFGDSLKTQAMRGVRAQLSGSALHGY
jgi:hypothetical protein